MPEDVTQYGLSPAGFKRKRLPEIIASINARIADTLGKPIQTSANSVLGQIVGVFAFEIADEWEQTENVYNAMYPSTAQGASLSNVAGLAGIQLVEAEYTTLILTCFGTDGTEIPYLAQVTDGKYTYSCQDVYRPIEASRSNVIGVKLASNSISAGVEYALTIDNEQKTYTATASDTAAGVLRGLAKLFSFDDRIMWVENGALMITMEDSRKTMEVFAGPTLIISVVASPFLFKCDTAGAVDPVLGTVTQIVTPYSGWNSVENDAPASVGRDSESDSALRSRWSRSVYNRASAMSEAIQAALYQVSGVTIAVVYENTKNTTDQDGRPAHSIEAVVRGGEDAEIASIIWRYKAAGIDTYGFQSVDILDSQRILHTIHFNRPSEIPIYIRVQVMRNPEKAMSSAALARAKQAIANQGNSLQVGQDVVLQAFYGTIMEATSYAVGYINLAASKDGESYSMSNIAISPREIAAFSLENITVEVVS